MEQCLHCEYMLFFDPFGGDSYTCCSKHGENFRDIDIKTGFSPAIFKHGLNEVPCCKFSPGTSICNPAIDKPFLLNPIRQEGEEYLRKILTNSYQI